MNGIWEKSLDKSVPEFKGFPKEEESAKLSTAVVEIVGICSLAMGEDNIEALLEVVPENRLWKDYWNWNKNTSLKRKKKRKLQKKKNHAQGDSR